MRVEAACGRRATHAAMLHCEPPLAVWLTRVGAETNPAPDPGLSAASWSLQSLETAVAPVRATAITAFVERGALLGARAAGHRLLGGDLGAGGHWQPVHHLELL